MNGLILSFVFWALWCTFITFLIYHGSERET